MGTRYIAGTHSLNGAQSDHDIGHNETYCDNCDEPTNGPDLAMYKGEQLCTVCDPRHVFRHIAGQGMACIKCRQPWSRRIGDMCTGEAS